MSSKEIKLKDLDYTLMEGGAWFTVDNISVRLSKTDEGVVCDMYPVDREEGSPLATAYAFFADATLEVEA